MFEDCVKRPLSDNTSNNIKNSRVNIVETNKWPQQIHLGGKTVEDEAILLVL